MMTKATKPIRRVFAGMTNRDVVVTLYPNNIIGLRLKRSRKEYTFPLVRVFRLAVEAEHEAEKAAKRKRRKLVNRGLLATGRGGR